MGGEGSDTAFTVNGAPYLLAQSERRDRSLQLQGEPSLGEGTWGAKRKSFWGEDQDLTKPLLSPPPHKKESRFHGTGARGRKGLEEKRGRGGCTDARKGQVSLLHFRLKAKGGPNPSRNQPVSHLGKIQSEGREGKKNRQKISSRKMPDSRKGHFSRNVLEKNKKVRRLWGRVPWIVVNRGGERNRRREKTRVKQHPYPLATGGRTSWSFG